MNMKTLLVAAGVSLVAAVVFSSNAWAESPVRPLPTEVKKERTMQGRVRVTGSHIPQRVKVRPIGTATVSQMRVIPREEIDKSNARSAADILHDVAPF